MMDNSCEICKHKKRGRPPKETTKSIRCQIRMTEEEHSVLNYLAEKKGMTKTEIINEALMLMYSFEKYCTLMKSAFTKL